MINKLVMSFAALFSVASLAQAPPGTDIFLADLTVNNGLLQLKAPVNITNRVGYDNQPLFLPDGKQLFYTSSRGQGDAAQTEAMLYDLTSGTVKNVTQTPSSEYSPTLMPAGQEFSVIRVADDGKQKFWAYPMQQGQPRELLADVEPVGYHAWVDAEQVILFVLGEPHRLVLANINTGKTRVIDQNIGASLFKIPNKTTMSYSKGDDPAGENNQIWTLFEWDPASGSIKALTTLPKGAYYYTWTADGKVLAAQKTKLLQWDSKAQEQQSGWQEFADVAAQCPAGVSRMAVHPHINKVALVCDRR